MLALELDCNEQEEIGEDNIVLEQGGNGALIENVPGTVSNHPSELPIYDCRKINSFLTRKDQGLAALSCLLISLHTIIIQLDRCNELAAAARKIEH